MSIEKQIGKRTIEEYYREVEGETTDYTVYYGGCVEIVEASGVVEAVVNVVSRDYLFATTLDFGVDFAGYETCTLRLENKNGERDIVYVVKAGADFVGLD